MNLYLKLFCFWQESLHWYYHSSEHLHWHITWPALPHPLPITENKNRFLMTSSTFFYHYKNFQALNKRPKVTWHLKLSCILPHANLKQDLQSNRPLLCSLWWLLGPLHRWNMMIIAQQELSTHSKNSLHKGNWTKQPGKHSGRSTPHESLHESKN